MKTMSREPPYWSQWADKIITRYDLKLTSKGTKEYHGPCPSCGGVDRFWINEYQGEVKVHCRQCGDTGWKDIIAELEHDGCWPIWNAPLQSLDNVVQLSPEFSEEQDPFQPYHERKGVTLIGAKLDGLDVVVPLFNAEKERVGYQRITPDGIKKFNRGLDKTGGVFGVCGKGLTDGGTVYLAEGWATSASVWEATQRPCIFGLDAANLQTVCEAFSVHFPDIPIVIAGDNDSKGIECAKACNKPYVVPSEAGADWNDVHQRHGLQAVKDGLAKVVRQKRLFTHVDDLVVTKPDWLIDGLLERNTLCMCFGAAGSGKSFTTIDMGLCIATGKDFHGHAVKQGAVFYIAGEGHGGFARRVAAWKKHHNIKDGEAKLYKSNRAVIMSDPDSVKELRSEIDALHAVAGTPQVIIIDTLARSLGGASENDGKDINLFIMACDELAEEYECTVLLVHHTGHQNKDRGRGASQINAALESEFRIEQWGEGETAKILLTFTKQKEDKLPDPMAFVKLPVSIMTDDLTPVESIVLEYTPDMPLGGDSMLNAAQSALVSLFKEKAENDEIERDILRNYYVDANDTGNRDSAKRKFNRVINELFDKNWLQQENGVISMGSDYEG